MKPEDDYNYETAGFDSFLSRSIDGTPQTSLDSQGPVSQYIGYDHYQFGGSTSDTIRIGQTKVDRDGVKVAVPGSDVTSAGDGELSLDSSRSNFYIVKKFSGTMNVAADTNNQCRATFSHNLGYRPDRIEANCVPHWIDLRSVTLPAILFNSKNYFGADAEGVIEIEGFDEGNIYVLITVQGIFGLSWIATLPTINFNFFCLKATPTS